MSMSAERQRVNGWWKRQGSLTHRFVPKARRSRVCLVCAATSGADQHLGVKGR